MQCLEYIEVDYCRPHYRQCKQADLPLTTPANFAWCAQGCHHCRDEGPREGLAGIRALNIVSSCASEQPHPPLKTILDKLQVSR